MKKQAKVVRKVRSRVAESSPAESVMRSGANTRATNLTLNPAAIAKGEAFSELHGTSLSKLVNGFLDSLPSLDEGSNVSSLSPTLKRLYGAAAGGNASIADYKEFLYNKHTKK